jgi:cyclopropane fatty-acyl-phospholipid synthase-like methyltransferase
VNELNTNIPMDHYKDTFQTWDKLATSYQDRFMDLDLYNDTYDRFCALIEKQGASIFEIGCGPGNITRYLLAQRPDFKIKATDIAPSMLALAKENNPAIETEIMDCRDIGKVQEQFDGIVCGFCLPYLSKDDSNKFIKDCSGLLPSGGILYFSAIEDDYTKSNYETSGDGQHKVFVYYHEADYLLDWLAVYGFETMDCIRKQYVKADGTATVHVIFIAKRR